MKKLEPYKTECRECHWTGTTDLLLVGISPFDAGETVYGCPKCKAIDSDMQICDEPGCKKPSSCGFPDKKYGCYRRTCYEHSKI